MPSPTDGTPASRAPLVGGLHDPGPAAGDDREALLAEPPGQSRAPARSADPPRGVRAEPKIETALPMRASAWKPLRSSSWMRRSRCASVSSARIALVSASSSSSSDERGVAGRMVVAHLSRVGGSMPSRRGRRVAGMAEGPAYTRLDVDERRRRLLELGTDLFARFSYDELSMARIAARGGDLEGAHVPLLPQQAGVLRRRAGGEGRRAGDAHRDRPVAAAAGSADGEPRRLPRLGRRQPRGLREARAQRRARSPRCGRSSTACAT